MAEILILDPDPESIEKCKKMLTNLEKEHEIIYTTYPEQAMEIIRNNELSVVIAENKMEVLDSIELSDMIRIMHPTIVQLLMTEVTDISSVLETLNNTDIFEIILKPFRFPEDLEEPIKRAFAEHDRRAAYFSGNLQSKKHIHHLNEEYDKLKTENFRRTHDYSNLFRAFSGMIHTHISLFCKEHNLTEVEKEHMTIFVQDIVREYVTTYVFEFKTMEELKKKLIDGFDDSTNSCAIAVNIPDGLHISDQKAKDIYFATYLMAHLCQKTLIHYQMKMAVEQQQNFYFVKFVCDPKDSVLNGRVMYVENDASVRDFMHDLVEVCLKKIFMKSIKGYQGNPYVAVATTVIDS